MTREEVFERIRAHLSEELEVEGIATTRDFAIEVLRSDAFASGDYNTSFIEEHGALA